MTRISTQSPQTEAMRGIWQTNDPGDCCLLADVHTDDVEELPGFAVVLFHRFGAEYRLVAGQNAWPGRNAGKKGQYVTTVHQPHLGVVDRPRTIIPQDPILGAGAEPY